MCSRGYTISQLDAAIKSTQTRKRRTEIYNISREIETYYSFCCFWCWIHTARLRWVVLVAATNWEHLRKWRARESLRNNTRWLAMISFYFLWVSIQSFSSALEHTVVCKCESMPVVSKTIFSGFGVFWVVCARYCRVVIFLDNFTQILWTIPVTKSNHRNLLNGQFVNRSFGKRQRQCIFPNSEPFLQPK